MGGGDPFLARLGVYTDQMVGDIYFLWGGDHHPLPRKGANIKLLRF